jgi:hypothetical protein
MFFHPIAVRREHIKYLSEKGLVKLTLGFIIKFKHERDRPGKPPKPLLKAPKVDKQLEWLALFWKGRTPRGGASSIPSHAHAHTT